MIVLLSEEGVNKQSQGKRDLPRALLRATSRKSKMTHTIIMAALAMNAGCLLV
jgi:hypothetical protein